MDYAVRMRKLPPERMLKRLIVARDFDPALLNVAFVFLFLGYGTKVGLVPVHNWLPDAHAEGPTPVSAVLSGLLLNVALYAVLRCKVLTDGALHSSVLSGRLMMGFGLLSVVAAVFFLIRQKDVKRMFAYSSIEHMGLMTFAFGVGGSVRAGALAMDGDWHDLGSALGDEEREPVALQPLAAIDDVNNNRNMSKTFDSVKALMEDLNADN